MTSSESKIVSRDRMVAASLEARANGDVVVLTNGCFDILHTGHVTYLESARNLGTLLLVGINSDDSLRRLKGPPRPFNTEQERARVVAALESVDLVTIFGEETATQLVETVEPNIYVKGGDYSDDPASGDWPKGKYPPEARALEAYNGRLVVLPFVPGYSTTDIVERIQASSV